MARNDGIDRTSVRNLAVSDKAVGNTQQHNEREKDSYRNPDIIPQRAAWNVHFKKPIATHDLNGCFVGILIELLGELVATVIVKIGRVDIKDKLAVMGGIRLQAAR